MLSLIFPECMAPLPLLIWSLKSCRYMAGVALRFLTDELGFDSDEDCTDFLTSHGAQHLIETKINDKNERQTRVKVKEGAGLFESLRTAAFSKVDIKGQI